MSVHTESQDLMSARVEVQRIDHTASIWFAAALIAASLPLAGLLLSGWHASDLAGGAQTAWWIGFTINAIGLAGIGYAGCPIYWGSVEVAHQQKSIAIRGGLVFFLVGGWIAVLALLA